MLLTKNVALFEGLAGFAMLALLQWCVARLSIISRRFRSPIRSQPRLLVHQGELREAAMRKERITSGEIDAAVRSSGLGRMEEVGAVVLETDGTLSVLRASDKPLTLLRYVQQ